MTMRKAILFGTVGAVLALTSVAVAQTPVEKLIKAGRMSFRLQDSAYYIRIGVDCGIPAAGGGIGNQAPICVTLSDLNNDGVALDFEVTIQQMVNTIQSNERVQFYGTPVGTNQVRWQGSRTFDPPACAFIGGSVNQWFSLREVFGDFTMQIDEGACNPDPYSCTSCGADLTLTPVGNDPNNQDVNFLGFEGFIRLAGTDCDTGSPLRACARTWAINTIAYSSSLPSQGDVNGDCTIDDADLLTVLFDFGGSGAGDVNSDGIVDDADLLTVLFNFGSSC
jgi:hypothetical protein